MALAAVFKGFIFWGVFLFKETDFLRATEIKREQSQHNTNNLDASDVHKDGADAEGAKHTQTPLR